MTCPDSSVTSRPRSGSDIRPLRGLLLLAALGLAQCHDGGGDGGIDDIAIVSAYPQLTFPAPVFFAQAPGDAARAFVVSQAGTVHVFSHTSSASGFATFLGISGLVTDDGGEQGLLGLAFDPGFASNGYLYVNYNPNFDGSDNDPPRRTRIARFQVTGNPDVVDPATETTLLEFDQPEDFSNHKGGWIGFGPDDKLYIASGDGGSGGDPQNLAQNLDSLLGKILRINADGSVPADNPFIATGADEIWAYGLRNPFRASFDRVGGELWVGDVGQGQREEIDVVVSGGNYGWRKFEGTRVHNASDPDPGNALPPLYEYDHSGGRCSVIGGYVYRGSALPAHVGEYFFADFCSREVWVLVQDGAGVTRRFVGTVPGNPTSFGEDLAGELYITAFDGKVYKLVPG
jgi:glucose/arabinose dehydrogenase